MIKTLLIALSLLTLSLNASALTLEEEDAFRTKVQEMSNFKRGRLIVYNLVSTVGACGFGGAYSVVSVVADTIPLAAEIQNNFTKNSENDSYGYTGGLGALITDFVTLLFDLTDEDIDEAVFTETIKAYDDSRAAHNAAFNQDTGYCSKQADQLTILLGLK